MNIDSLMKSEEIVGENAGALRNGQIKVKRRANDVEECSKLSRGET